MLEIRLKGHAVLFDECDAEVIARHKWHYRPASAGQVEYAYTYVRTGPTRASDGRKLVSMHRLLLGNIGPEVDHRNGNGLDNRRANLRAATRAQNAKNLPARVGCASPFKGVSIKRHKRSVKFVVQIKQDGECLKVGTFDSEHRAARAYDGAARLFHGSFARTNKDLGLYDLHPDRGSQDVHLV